MGRANGLLSEREFDDPVVIPPSKVFFPQQEANIEGQEEHKEARQTISCFFSFQEYGSGGRRTRAMNQGRHVAEHKGKRTPFETAQTRTSAQISRNRLTTMSATPAAKLLTRHSLPDFMCMTKLACAREFADSA